MAACGRLGVSFRSSAKTVSTTLGFYAKVAICCLLIFYVGLVAFVALVTPSRIAQFMYDLAVEIRRLPYGYFILVGAIILISFPPFVGHSTLMNICGFTYGTQGVVPAAISTVGGSALAFVLLRSLFINRLRKWAAANEKWGALEAAIRFASHYSHPRLAISAMGVLKNSLFASIESVSLTQFVFATLFVLPRVMVYVFVGSRIANLSDGEQRSHMDATTRFINGCLIVGGIVISMISSSAVYYFVKKEIDLLHGGQPATGGLDEEDSEDTEEGVPLLVHS